MLLPWYGLQYVEGVDGCLLFTADPNSQLKLQFGKCHCSPGFWLPERSWCTGLSLKWLKKEQPDSPWGILVKTSTKWKILHQSIYRTNFWCWILDQLRENFTFIFTLGKWHHKLSPDYFLSICDTIWNVFWNMSKWLLHSFCIFYVTAWFCPSLINSPHYEIKLTQQFLKQTMYSLNIRHFW